MVIEDMGNGYVRITVNGGRVRDIRTGRTYSKVVVNERNARYFDVA